MVFQSTELAVGPLKTKMQIARKMTFWLEGLFYSSLLLNVSHASNFSFSSRYRSSWEEGKRAFKFMLRRKSATLTKGKQSLIMITWRVHIVT